MSDSPLRGLSIPPPFARALEGQPVTSTIHNQAMGQIERTFSALHNVVTYGTTAQRPPFAPSGSVAQGIGQQYFDTTLGIPIWWKGSVWVNASGTPV